MLKINNDLLKGSVILLIAFNIYNVINFFFQFSMARMLSVIDYGILATLYSIIYIMTIFSESIQTIMMKYSSPEKNQGKLKNIIKRSLNKAIKTSLVLFAIYLIIAIPLSYLLEISYLLLALDGLIIFSSLLIPVNRGIMLGKKMFTSLAGNLLIESLVKIILAISLVFVGWRVYGPMAATIISLALAFIFSFSSLKSILRSREEVAKIEGIYKYSAPVFFITLVITLFYSIDIIIAKIVFDSTTAGAYAIASILSKTIFWGTQPISRAMFPISAGNVGNNKQRHSVLASSFVFLSLCIILALAAFYFFPDLIVSIFSGKAIASTSSILILTGISLSLLSFTNLILLYNLSLGRTKGLYYFAAFVIIEAVLLFYFSSNITQFSLAFVASSAIFLIGSIFVLRGQK